MCDLFEYRFFGLRGGVFAVLDIPDILGVLYMVLDFDFLTFLSVFFEKSEGETKLFFSARSFINLLLSLAGILDNKLCILDLLFVLPGNAFFNMSAGLKPSPFCIDCIVLKAVLLTASSPAFLSADLAMLDAVLANFDAVLANLGVPKPPLFVLVLVLVLFINYKICEENKLF